MSDDRFFVIRHKKTGSYYSHFDRGFGEETWRFGGNTGRMYRSMGAALKDRYRIDHMKFDNLAYSVDCHADLEIVELTTWAVHA